MFDKGPGLKFPAKILFPKLLSDHDVADPSRLMLKFSGFNPALVWI